MAGGSQADVYRTYAEACVRIAQNVSDDFERSRWISMAQQWLQWAQEVEAAKAPES